MSKKGKGICRYEKTDPVSGVQSYGDGIDPLPRNIIN